MIKNKKRQKDLRKEIVRFDKEIHKAIPTNCPKCGVKLSSYKAIEKHIKKYNHYGDYNSKSFRRPTDLFQFREYEVNKAKLSENILAHNNCLEDFSEKVKEGIKECERCQEYPQVTAWIDKIKNKMKIKEGNL